MSEQYQTKTIKYIILKPLNGKPPQVKFVEDEMSHVISQNVMEKTDFDKYPIKKGDVVSVAVENDEVVYLRKDKNEKKEEVKKEEPKPEPTVDKTEDSKPEPKEVVKKILTIEAVGKNEVIMFKEEKINGYKWTKVSEELKKTDLIQSGFKAGTEVEVELNDGVIQQMTVVAQKEEKKEETKSYSKKSSNSTNDSIERQVALKEAGATVRSYIESKSVNVDSLEKTKQLIKDLAKTYYEALTELN